MSITVRNYPAPPFNKKEILRYAGAKESSEFDTLIDECISEVKDKLCYKVCFEIFEISRNEADTDLGFAKTSSLAVKKKLDGCCAVLLFAATVGTEIDRLVARCAKISPTKALFINAIGAERTEALCNAFCDNIKTEFSREGYDTGTRFSPGYSDFPLDIQKKIFEVLDCPRKIGLSLNESLLMSPSKSVTALVGIKQNFF